MRTSVAPCEDCAMRTSARGVRLVGRRLSVTFEGRAVECVDGDTVAAALVDAGELACRTDRSGGSRGVFCGMGVCQDCVVLVDGVPARACMTPARAGSTIRALAADAAPPPQPKPLLEHVTL